MWDDGNPYSGCTAYDVTSGPDCVGDTNPGRNGALVLRAHMWNGFSESHVFDASLYWHRRQDEEEDFEDEMTDLVNDIKSSDYGMNINIGANTTLTVDQSAMSVIGGITSTAPSAGITNLGTWHRHWEPDDPQNPLLIAPSSD